MNVTIYGTIFSIAIILILANVVRSLSLQFKIPPVIGLIILGILLGPSIFHLTDSTPTIKWIADVGVLLLIFSAGIETDFTKLKHESKKAAFPALFGVVVPFIAGSTLSLSFGYPLITSLLVGTIFTATSISISLMTLIDLNKLNTVEGRCIVTSAIIDDIIGIIVLSLVLSFASSDNTSSTLPHHTLLFSLLMILIFFVLAYLVGKYLIMFIFLNSKKLNLEGSLLSLAVAVIFFYAWFAEKFEVAAITGAFVAGLILGQTSFKETIHTGITNLGKSFFIDVFFVNIGLGLNLKMLTFSPLYQILFVILAVVSKAFGSTIGALIAKFDFSRSVHIGIGMVPRGEVALIMGTVAYQQNLIDIDILSTTIIMVIITSILTPILIKFSYSATMKETFHIE